MFIEEGTTKSRSLKAPSFSLRGYWRLPSNPPVPWNLEGEVKASLGGTQITESDGNRWPLPKGGDLQDHGSEFFSIKKEVLNGPKFKHVTFFRKPVAGHGPAEHMLVGNHIANCFVTMNSGNELGKPVLPLKYNFPPDLSSSRADLIVKGTQAIAACQPTNQIANAASFVGELMQDVPAIPGVHLWESRLRAAEVAARASGEFLNVMFGILPTVGDMELFVKGVHKVDKAVDQFIRDSGRVVRRKFVFPVEHSETETDISGGVDGSGWIISPAGIELISGASPFFLYPNVSNNLGEGVPGWRTMRTRTIERKTWFSGAFTYHLPSGYDTHSKADRRKLMARLYGANPDLNTLWQLAPWSWAVDWFSDAGSFVKNLQAHISYGTVLRYGYIMETTTVTDTFFAGDPGQTYRDWQTFPSTFPTPSPVTLRTTVKKRVKANPFGFGLSWEGLSTLQQAIAAALGISRVAR